MKLSVDRIEESYAVCQDFLTEKMLDIPIKLLPNGIKEGDVIIKNEDGTYIIDKEETKKRKDFMLKLQERVLKKSDKTESES